MRSQLSFTMMFLASVPAFSHTLELTGGAINFGSAPLHIAVVSPNGGGTRGHLAPAIPSGNTFLHAWRGGDAGWHQSFWHPRDDDGIWPSMGRRVCVERNGFAVGGGGIA